MFEYMKYRASKCHISIQSTQIEVGESLFIGYAKLTDRAKSKYAGSQ